MAPCVVAELVESAAAGKPAGWDGLVEEFGGLVWAVARSHRLPDADASDVAQATWLSLIEHIGDLKQKASVGAWLATTARRECLRILRDARRYVALRDELPDQPSGDPQPGEALLLEDRDRALWRGFARLRSSDQALLRLLMADPPPSYEEVSAALDMPIGSIGPTRARALGRLRQELDNQGTLAFLAM
jgi:RNA polymerase sigma factor (sigma-70 family)